MADGSDGSEVEVHRQACREARHTITEQVNKINESDRKAISILRGNILLIGVLVSGLSIATQTDSVSPPSLINVHSLVGILLLTLSTVVAAVAYGSSNIDMGLGPGFIEEVEEEAYDEKDFLIQLNREYVGWLSHNKRINEFNSYAIALTLIFAINAVLFLISGILVGVLNLSEIASGGLFVAVLLVGLVIDCFVYFAEGVYKQVSSEG